MNKPVFFLFSFSFSLFAYGEDAPTEIIEVLAPKQALSQSTASQANAYLDDAFSYSQSRTIADRLITIPGVSLNGQGGQFQSYSIRGFSRGRIRTEVDGIPIITDRRAGNSVSFVSPDLIGTGQVIKGPSSALYGSQALGGVVSLSTEMLDETYVKLGVQSENDGIDFTVKQQTRSLGIGNLGTGNLATGLSYQKANNDKATNGDELNSAFERLSGFVRYQIESEGYTTHFSWLPSVGQDIGKSSIKYPEKEITQYPKELHSLAQVQVNADTGWLVKLFHHYQNWDSETLRVGQYEALTAYQSHTLGGQWLLVLDGLNLNCLDFAWLGDESFIGIDWLARENVKIDSQYQIFSEQNDLPDELFDDTTAGEEDNVALFSKHSWNWQNTKFGVGLRYDWLKQQGEGEESVTESQFNASMSLAYEFSQQLNVELDIANGFRYPTISERYFNGRTPRGFTVGNKDLVPEESLGGQLAMRWLADNSLSDALGELSFNGTAYYYDLDNYIERYNVNDEMRSYRNLDEAEIYGFEAELRWVMSNNLEHYLSYQRQKGEDGQGQTIDDLVPQKLNWTMFLTFGDWSITHGLNHLYQVDDVGGSETTRDSYTLWDVSLDYQLSERQTLNLIINNLGNQAYYGSLDEDASLQPERSIRISSTWRL